MTSKAQLYVIITTTATTVGINDEREIEISSVTDILQSIQWLSTYSSTRDESKLT